MMGFTLTQEADPKLRLSFKEGEHLQQLKVEV